MVDWDVYGFAVARGGRGWAWQVGDGCGRVMRQMALDFPGRRAMAAAAAARQPAQRIQTAQHGKNETDKP